MNDGTLSRHPLRRITLLYSILIGSIIVAASLGRLPVRPVLRHVPWADKAGHFLLIGGLAYLLNRTFGERPGRLRLWQVNGLLIILVVAEEVLQRFLYYRAFEMADLVADAAGMVVFGSIAHWQMWRRRRAKSSGDGE